MCSDIAIRVSYASKHYQIYDKPIDRLKQSLFRGRRQYYKEFKALDHVSFEVKKGETVGIIGRNGSGKSTLLQMICGTLSPTSGSIEVNGRVAALLELGAGFNPEFTGRENVYMNAAIQGMSREEVDKRYDAIAAFAEIGEFIEQPVKTYSSGMYVRLAFSVAINVEPDILIVDEALSVGDMNFQAKCMTAISRIKDAGATVLFVSHDINAVKSICERCVYLEAGVLKMTGKAGEVAEKYIKEMREEANASVGQIGRVGGVSAVENVVNKSKDESFKKSDEFISRVSDYRYGTGGIFTTCVELLDTNNQIILAADFDQTIQVKIYFESLTDATLAVCYYIMDEKRNLILGAGPRQVGQPYLEVKPGEQYIVTYKTKVPLQEGDYSIQVQLNDPMVEGGYTEYMDVIDNAVVFKILRNTEAKIWTKAYVENEMSVLQV